MGFLFNYFFGEALLKPGPRRRGGGRVLEVP